MVSRDWAAQYTHECIVGWPCRFCPTRNLGLRAIGLGGSRTRSPLPTKAHFCAGHIPIALLTGMRWSVPLFGCDVQDRGVWCDHRDRGTGSTKVRAGRSIP
jgi:hypothetical protein